MARPKKSRRVCRLPDTSGFVPIGCRGRTPIVMTVDEFEVIRLMDREGYSQESCAARMGVGRSTIQQMYQEARRKLAEALVEGKPLRIEGGDYALCDEKEPHCGRGCCPRRCQNEIGERT